MPEQFTGKVEFLDSKGNVVLTIDPDSDFVQVVLVVPGGQQVMQLTNTGSFSLVGDRDEHGARLDGSIGTLILGGAGRDGKVFLRDRDKNHIFVLDTERTAMDVGTRAERAHLRSNGSGAETIRLNGNSGIVEVTGEFG